MASVAQGWVKAKLLKTLPIVYETTPYEKFKKEIAEHIKKEIPVKYKGYVDVVFCVAFWSMRDTDSATKALLDAIEDSGLVTNDRFVRDIVHRRYYHKRDELDKIRIKIEPVPKESKRLPLGAGKYYAPDQMELGIG